MELQLDLNRMDVNCQPADKNSSWAPAVWQTKRLAGLIG